MNPTSTQAPYIAHVIDTDGNLHIVRVTAIDTPAAKRTARKVAKAQGVAVKYVESAIGVTW